MRKLTTLLTLIFLSLGMAMAQETVLFSYNGSGIGTGNGYETKTGTFTDKGIDMDMTATIGSVQSATAFWLGTNSNAGNIAKSNLADYSAIASAVGLTVDVTRVAALLFNTPLSGVAKVTYKHSAGQANTNLALVYSTDNGTTYTQVGDWKPLETDVVTYEFTSAVSSAIYAFVAYKTDGTGYMQSRVPEITFYTSGGSSSSSDATLKSLKVNGEEIFQAGKTEYSQVLPEGTTVVPTVVVETSDVKATSTITNAESLPGTTTIKVTAENGTEKTYTVAFTVDTPSEITDLVVGFNKYTQGNPPADGVFFAMDGNAANKGIATLIRDEAGSNYAVNQDGVAASAGWDAADETEKYWIATFSTVGVENLTLTSLHRSSNTGPKDFKVQYKVAGGAWTDLEGGVVSSANDNYLTGRLESLELPAALNGKESVSLRWLCTSTVSVNGGTVASGGVNRIDVEIYEGDAPILSINNKLSELSVSLGELTPAFDPETTSYSVVLPEDNTTIPAVTYKLADEAATAVVTNAEKLPGATTIVVTAESGDKKTYTIAFRNANPAGVWKETWETGVTKTGYAVADFQGTACLWEVAGVINADTNDKRNDSQSVRLRDPNASNADPHYILMKEDKVNGAGTITLYHGMYGTHEGGAYTLEVSNDGGATWAYQADVEEVPTAWSEKTFTVNMEGNIRIKITKATAQVTSTINIDDITITDYTSVGIGEGATTSNVYVYADQGVVYVKNVEKETLVNVYDVVGQLVKTTTDHEFSLAKGLYIVRVNGRAFKVLSK